MATGFSLVFSDFDPQDCVKIRARAKRKILKLVFMIWFVLVDQVYLTICFMLCKGGIIGQVKRYTIIGASYINHTFMFFYVGPDLYQLHPFVVIRLDEWGPCVLHLKA